MAWRPFQVQEARSLLAAGYGDVDEVYIDAVPVSALAVSSLEGLAGIDPKLWCRMDDGVLTMYRGQAAVAQASAPESDSADDWAETTARLVERVRTSSPPLRQAAAARIHEALFDGLVDRLDGYSVYAGPEKADVNRAMRHGFAGIGVRVRAADGGAEVVSIEPRSPAARAGLRQGELITHVDGQPLAGLERRDMERMLRGIDESRVHLTVRREDGGGRRGLALARVRLGPRTVSARRMGDVAYVRVSRFSEVTAEEVRDALRPPAGEEAPAAVVLDLRDNPGGLLDEAVEVADLFLRRGRIVSVHGRHPDTHQLFDADAEEVAAGLPLVLLINGGSASGAEIVAAALKDAGRAVLVGSTTYGKGTVQTVNELPNDGELVLTWARYQAPSGYLVEHAGVTPALCTSDRRMHAVLSSLDGDAAGDACPRRQVRANLDLQLALRLLHNDALYARALSRQAGERQRTAAMRH